MEVVGPTAGTGAELQQEGAKVEVAILTGSY